MKERPMLLNSEMVKAVLDGRKTQTRRLIRWPKIFWVDHTAPDVKPYWRFEEASGSGPFIPNDWIDYCPFGQPGDRLWVRETFAVMVEEHDEYPFDIFGYAYKATDISADPDKWTPSIHMPRRASRVTLKITGVKVERLQEITEKDAQAEGCLNDVKLEYGHMTGPIDYRGLYAVERFEELWDSLYPKKPEYQWQADPWVWCITFKRKDLK